MDANGDGVLEASEIPEERKRMFGFMAERMGIDPNGKISIDEIRERMTRRFSSPDREGRGEPGEEREEGSAKSAGERKPLVPGFGVDQDLARVPEFGERVESIGTKVSAGSSRSRESRGRPGSDGDRDGEERYRMFARGLLSRFDRNQSGALERDEWDDMRGRMRSDPKEIDRNNDGVITQDELSARLAEYGRRRNGGSDGDGSESAGPAGSGSSPWKDRKSYRFLSAAERLPEGLPEWFARQDANGDGQVAMAEFESYWSEARAREFERLDLNRDGIITPRECLEAPAAAEELASLQEAPQPASSTAGSGSSGTGSSSAGSSSTGSSSTSGAWWLSP